jgi:hypothetical protein
MTNAKNRINTKSVARKSTSSIYDLRAATRNMNYLVTFHDPTFYLNLP